MSAQLAKTLSLIDDGHQQDPNTVTLNGQLVPYELHYARKCTAYLEKREPNASDELKIAVRAQHFRRWEVPRADYPMTRPGYHSWRSFLKKRQAEQASQICLDCGYTQDEAERVAALIRKEDLKVDSETQALEDVACLVFLDDQFEEFEKHHDEDKILGILRKTWGKMTTQGQQMALALPMEGRPKELIEKALSG